MADLMVDLTVVLHVEEDLHSTVVVLDDQTISVVNSVDVTVTLFTDAFIDLMFTTLEFLSRMTTPPTTIVSHPMH